jgi:LPS-assembly lipoprotein
MTKNRRQISGIRTKQIFFCLLIPVLCLLSACDFEPVYGTHTVTGPTAEILQQVAIDNIADRNGQMLRNDLIDRMYGKGRPKKPLYHLAVKLTPSLQDLGVQANSTSTRSLLDMTATYSLTDAKGIQLLGGTAHSVTSFNKLSSQYGSLVSGESANERTINEVSEQIVSRLSLYFAEPAQGAQVKPTVLPPVPPPTNSTGLPTSSQPLVPMLPPNPPAH